MTLITKITEWQVQQMTLTHQEFIRRFALHILPKRFVKSITVFYCITETAKTQSFTRDLKGKVRKVERSLLPKCPCCKTAILHRIAVFDQRGPPAWYLGGSQTPFPVKAKLWVRYVCLIRNLGKGKHLKN
jgi:hypothetical protein